MCFSSSFGVGGRLAGSLMGKASRFGLVYTLALTLTGHPCCDPLLVVSRHLFITPLVMCSTVPPHRHIYEVTCVLDALSE